MIEDPIVEEVRKYREEHAHAYGYDLNQIVMALREREEKSKQLVVGGRSFSPGCLSPLALIPQPLLPGGEGE